MKAISHLSNFEKTSIAVASLLMLVALYLLNDDSWLNWGNRSAGVKIGKIEILDGDVRQRHPSEFSWLSARRNGSIHEGDSVFTGVSSRATVSLNDGSAVEMGPNSLVVFVTDKGRLNLNLEFGNFSGELTAEATVNLRQGDRLMQIKSAEDTGTAIRISQDLSGNQDIRVLSGSADLSGDGIDARTIAGGAIKISSTGEIDDESSLTGVRKLATNEEVKLTLLEPEDSGQIVYHSDRPITFLWNIQGEAASFELQLSETEDFNELLFKRNTTENHFTLSRYPKDRTFYWRVVALDTYNLELAKSDTRILHINSYDKIQIQSPIARESLEYIEASDGQLISSELPIASWNAPSEVTSFIVEISKNKDFRRILAKGNANRNQFQIEPLPQGDYFLRVRPAEPEKQLWEIDSEPVAFSVIRTRNEESAISEVAEAPPVEEKLEFLPGTTEDNEKLSTTLTPKTNGASTITYQARTASDLGPPKDVSVSWVPVSEAHSYEVEYSNVSDFSRRRAVISQGREAQLTLPQSGSYFWRVRSLNEKGEAISRFSEPEALNYWLSGKDKLVNIREPKDNTIYFLRSDGTALVWLHWTPFENATKYEVQISTDPVFQRNVYTESTKIPRFLVDKALVPGRYYWRVRVYIDDSPAHWTGTHHFSLKPMK